MATLYIKTAEGLLKISGENLTKAKIIELLGYTPSNLPNIVDDESDEFYLTDKNGNVIMKVDADGVHTTEVDLNGVKVSEALKNVNENILDDESDVLQIVDTKGNIIAKIDKDGIHTTELDLNGVKVSEALKNVNSGGSDLSNIVDDESDTLYIVDGNGNIVAQIDANGVNAVDILLNHQSMKPLLNDGTPGLEYEIIYDIDWTTYEQWDSGTRMLSSMGTATSKDIRIASHIDGHPVTQITGSVFSGTDIETVTIPDTVVSIAGSVFKNCTSLKDVSLPHGARCQIYTYAFNGCTSLTSITIPGNIYDVADYAFYQSGLESVRICPGVESIGDLAFSETNLEHVDIPEGVTEIGNGAFSNCPFLQSVKIPNSATTIGAGAFHGNPALKSVTFYPNTQLSDKNTFLNCTNLTTVMFEGTLAQWDAKFDSWTTPWYESSHFEGTPDDLVIYCTDGRIAKDGTVTRNVPTTIIEIESGESGTLTDDEYAAITSNPEKCIIRWGTTTRYDFGFRICVNVSGGIYEYYASLNSFHYVFQVLSNKTWTITSYQMQKKLYRHNITLWNSTEGHADLKVHATIISETASKYTLSSLATFLSDNGCDFAEYGSSGHAYQASGFGIYRNTDGWLLSFTNGIYYNTTDCKVYMTILIMQSDNTTTEGVYDADSIIDTVTEV